MIFSYIVTLTCVWWIVFYMVLPFGNQITEKPEFGHADSAPTLPRLGMKIVITSVIAVILTVIIIYSIDHGHVAKLITKVDTCLKLLK